MNLANRILALSVLVIKILVFLDAQRLDNEVEEVEVELEVEVEDEGRRG